MQDNRVNPTELYQNRIDGELANNETPLMLEDKTCFHGYRPAQCSCLPCLRGRTQVAFRASLFTKKLSKYFMMSRLKSLSLAANSAATPTHRVQF